MLNRGDRSDRGEIFCWYGKLIISAEVLEIAGFFRSAISETVVTAFSCPDDEFYVDTSSQAIAKKMFFVPRICE